MTKPTNEAKDEGAAAPRPVHFTETPEFIAAVAKASEAATSAAKAAMHAEMTPLIEALRQSKGEPAVADDSLSFARQMALAIAELTDADQGRKRTPPAELALRARARADMDAAIAKVRRKAEDYMATTGGKDPGADAPLYLAIGKSYLDEQLIIPFEVDPATKKPYPVSFVWMGVPNEAMRPVNEPAKEIYAFFRRSIGDEASEAPSPPGPGWITAGGLVIQGIHGMPVSMGQHRAAPDPESMLSGLYQRGPGEFDPRRDRINILGTAAEPARQTGGEGNAPRKGI